jgi:GTPase SAR1 family protein
METSAKTGLNTEELFVQAVKLLFKDYCLYKKNKEKNNKEKMMLKKKQKPEKEEKKRPCC